MTDMQVPGAVTQSKIKSLVGKKVSKEVKFCGENVKITKLSVAQIEEIQALARENQKKAEEQEANADDGMDIIRFVIRTAVEGADQLEDADFREFPMDELTTLTNTIMAYSGMQNEGK